MQVSLRCQWNTFPCDKLRFPFVLSGGCEVRIFQVVFLQPLAATVYRQQCIFTGVSNIVYTAGPTLHVVCCVQVQKRKVYGQKLVTSSEVCGSLAVSSQQALLQKSCIVLLIYIIYYVLIKTLSLLLQILLDQLIQFMCMVFHSTC